MLDSRTWQPADHESIHPLPVQTGSLASTPKRSIPVPNDLLAKRTQCGSVSGHSEVSTVPDDCRSQPLADLWDGIMQTTSELPFHLSQLRLQPLPHRLPKHDELPLPGLPTDVGQSQKAEGLRLAFTAPSTISGRKPTELDEA